MLESNKEYWHGKHVTLFSLLSTFLMMSVTFNAYALPPEIYVTLEPEDSVVSTKITKNRGMAIVLTYSDSGSKHAIVSIDARQVCAGAGLVVKRCGIEIAMNKELGPPKLKEINFSNKNNFGRLYRELYVLTDSFNMSNADIYEITYSHPWQNKEEIVFHSNSLLIAVVTPERLAELKHMLDTNVKLALASYQFRNPEERIQYPRYFRSKALSQIERMEAIKMGMEQDAVLYLLAPPDNFYKAGKYEGYDVVEWMYEMGPCSGYTVRFLNGRVQGASRWSESP